MAGTNERGDASPPTAFADLRGVRLGRCARRVLLLAPPPLEQPIVVLPAADGRAAAESHRRATRYLASLGLVELTWKSEVVATSRERQAAAVIWDGDAGVYREMTPGEAPVERTVERRAIRLTVLGELLVDRLRPTLENGRRIRWSAVIDSAD